MNKVATTSYQEALNILEQSFISFSKNEKFSGDLKNKISNYLPVFSEMPEGMLLPYIYQFADVDVMSVSMKDLVSTGLFHNVIYKTLLSDFSGGKKR